MSLNELPDVSCDKISDAVRRFGLYLIYRGHEAADSGDIDVRLFFERDELFTLGQLIVQHVDCTSAEEKS